MGLLTPIWRAASRALDRPLRGRQRVPGLKADVEVYLTTGSVPHLYASSVEDLFFAQGYVVAGDRLFQMDFMRHAAAGRLSELLGERPVVWRDLTVFLKGKSTVDLDHLVRCMGLPEAARKSVAAAGPKALEWLHAYAGGVNARIAEGRLPFEFQLLRHRPEPWTPEDTFLVEKAEALEMNIAWRAILVHAALAAKVKDPARLAALLPAYPRDARPIVCPAAATLAALAGAHDRQAGLGGPHAGSNNWALAGARTDSGAPFLCNDPHLQLTAPPALYIVHLSAGDIDLAGASMPGIPGILFGHNRDVAWGATLCVAHDTDLFSEELDQTGTRARTEHGWEDLVVRDEEIRVKGRVEPILRRVRSTRHGPLVTDVVAHDSGAHLAISWTAHQPSRGMDTAVLLSTARDFEEFRRAWALYGAPALNLVYADRAGHVGYQCAGVFPVRRGSPSYLPSPGWTGENDWVGFVPFNDLPYVLDPADGFVVTANNRIVPEDHPVYLSGMYQSPHRHARIVEVLSSRPRHTLADMARLQQDVKSRWALEIVDGVLKPLAAARLPMNPEARSALDRLCSWDGEARADSWEAAVFYAFYLALARRILRAELGPDLFHGYFEILDTSVVPLENLLTSRISPWLTPEVRDRDAAAALQDAVEHLAARMGPDRRRWRWGRMHRLFLRHRLHAVKALRPLLSPGPLETGGDGMTVNSGGFWFSEPAEHVVGAVYRQIFDLADWDRARVIVAGGQSGDPLSPRYRDLVGTWLAGGYLDLPFSRRAVVESGERAVLQPGEG